MWTFLARARGNAAEGGRRKRRQRGGAGAATDCGKSGLGRDDLVQQQKQDERRATRLEERVACGRCERTKIVR